MTYIQTLLCGKDKRTNALISSKFPIDVHATEVFINENLPTDFFTEGTYLSAGYGAELLSPNSYGSKKEGTAEKDIEIVFSDFNRCSYKASQDPDFTPWVMTKSDWEHLKFLEEKLVEMHREEWKGKSLFWKGKKLFVKQRKN